MMIASLRILFQTKSAYDYLDNQYEDDLDFNCILIFGFFGAFNGINTYLRDKIQISEYMSDKFMILMLIIAIAFGAVFGVLIGKYVTTYILYGMSKLLNGKAEVIDTRIIAAYSLIPTFFLIPITLINGFQNWDNIPSAYYWIFDLISALIWIWLLKIMIQGIMRFNNFSFLKALINISPILIIGLIRLIVIFIY